MRLQGSQQDIDKSDNLSNLGADFIKIVKQSVSRNYLHWLTNLPWGKATNECQEVEQVKKILNEAHYGIEDVKKRILVINFVYNTIKKILLKKNKVFLYLI